MNQREHTHKDDSIRRPTVALTGDAGLYGNASLKAMNFPGSVSNQVPLTIPRSLSIDLNILSVDSLSCKVIVVCLSSSQRSECSGESWRTSFVLESSPFTSLAILGCMAVVSFETLR